MTDSTPNEKVPEWRTASMLDRACQAKTFLVVHDFLTEAEARKVEERLKKWVREKRSER